MKLKNHGIFHVKRCILIDNPSLISYIYGKKAMEKRNEASKEVLRQILNRAIADPKFRAQVFKNPELALARLKLPKDQIQSISANFDKRMKRQIDAIDELINMLSAEVLCTGGGGCGIA